MRKDCELVRDALAEVNAIRGCLGLDLLADLPTGRRRLNCDCPLARGLSAGKRGRVIVEKHSFGVQDADAQAALENAGYKIMRGGYLRLPWAMAAFVAAFDRGELPEYDIGCQAVPAEEIERGQAVPA